MLRSLQHPCIIHLVGINIHPLCFALPLAPLGSLNTVLAEKRKGRGRWRRAPLSAQRAFGASHSAALASPLQVAATCLSAT